MAAHESSVNYRNLIRDLAEMYPYQVSDVVLVELIANSLDAKPTTIWIDFDPAARTLVVKDDGNGMTASDFEQYHDFAAGLKERGSGIGFAGVGAKVSFNIASRVTTETCSSTFFGGSDWHLQSKSKLVWEDIGPTHLTSHGTRVEVAFDKSARLTYANTKDLLMLVKRHYLPLLCSEFLDLYDELGYYSKNLRFVVGGKRVTPTDLTADFSLDNVKRFFPQKAGKKVGYGVLGLAANEYPVASDVCGVLLCTYGKVIKADLFNQFPGPLGPHILGLVEIPELVKFLTTSKTDFIRRWKHADFERLYDPVRREFKAWLMDVGMNPTEIAGTEEAARLERELRRLLDEVPELGEFFGFRTRKDVLQPSAGGPTLADASEGVQATFPIGEGEAGQGQGAVDVGEAPGETLIENAEEGRQAATPISRTSRRGPKIAFVEAPERMDLAWVDGNNVVINSGHPSYAKIQSDSSAKRLHNLFAVASAIQRFLAGDADAQTSMFMDRMMAAWGKK